MKNSILIFLVTILIAFSKPVDLLAQNHNIYDLFLKFEKLYYSGDLINAEACMIQVLESNEIVSDDYLVYAYNNLGVVNNLLGRFQESLSYYDRGELLINRSYKSHRMLPLIYSNKARIYNIQNDYPAAIEYLEQCLRIYDEIKIPDSRYYNNITLAYQNLGISYSGIKDFNTALNYFIKCADLRERHNLSNLAISYLNLANTFVKTGNFLKAEKLFIKSINEFEKELAIDYQRIADAYIDYGLFMRETGREEEALEYHTKALTISIKNFGAKHPYVSLAYKYIGDHYDDREDVKTALQYYQKSLIALVTNFNKQDIAFNPSLDSALLDVDLLKILQKKSEVLEKLCFQQNNPEPEVQSMKISLETIDLALQLIKRIRNDYMSEESRLYLMENEKETYLSATRISRNLYNLTGDIAYLNQMYTIARQAKSAILQNEITGNELFYSIGLPDSIMQKHKKILGDIAAYNHLIHEEVQKLQPDNKKTDFWKDALFEMNREKEKIQIAINEQFPRYRDLLQKTEPVSLEEIQYHLKKDETLIEYLLSNKYTLGNRKLYIFTITKKSIHFQEFFLDSLFVRNVETIKQNTQQVHLPGNYKNNFKHYTSALFAMYEKLIKPVENIISGSKLIIIPDEEIGYLPFDAFIRVMPDPGQSDFEGLEYLVNTYTISYGYSSSLVFNRDNKKKEGKEILAFSPDYRNSSNFSGNDLESLSGTGKEIKSIFRHFRGKEFTGDQATEGNFKALMQYPSNLHLAMHALSDTGNSRYSCLVFDPGQDTVEDGYLYDYEISLSRIRSPMVVLSACNTGIGTLYQGEGLMSLTRAFILAGASSVIKTLWDVNDDASAQIISSFYSHLARGKEKDVALRLAKLDYLDETSPAYKNPFYWAAYQVMGDKSPITNNRQYIWKIVIAVLILLIGGIYSVSFKRRRSFPA